MNEKLTKVRKHNSKVAKKRVSLSLVSDHNLVSDFNQISKK